MKSTFFLLGMMVFNFSAMAATSASQSVEQFCADRSDLVQVKDLFQDRSNLMAFTNQGGLGNGGVCWWHSRFQRSAAYLTIYKPAEAQPNQEEAKKLISKIRAGKSLIVIPGFRSFSEFSYKYRNLIQAELDSWQKADGIAKFNWVMGLKGSSTVGEENLSTMMDELYEYVAVEGNIAYQKLQIKGIVAHAWLVINMKKTSNGYELEVLDSNYANRTNFYKFTKGMTSFYHEYYGNFTPYLERRAELDNIKLAILEKCDPAEYKARKAKLDAERNRNMENSGG